MKCLLTRSAAVILAGLLACPAPNLWAAAVSPIATRTGSSGLTLPVAAQPGQATAGMNQVSLGFLAAPALQGAWSAVPGVSPKALLASPLAAQALPQAAMPALPLAAPASPEKGQAATSAKIGGMSHEVLAFLEQAGPVSQASAEQAQGVGAKVFKALLGGPADADSSAINPAGRPAQNGSGPNLKQQKMLHKLYEVAAIFAEQYAPIEEKKERFQLDLKREYDKAKDAILADPNITTRQFQDLLSTLVVGMRDYHVSISFNSTEVARLPFLVMGAEGKYYLAFIDRQELPVKNFPFQVGDEIVDFDGKPTGEAVRELSAKLGGNTAQTDQRLAELFLTNRRRSRGDQVPQGEVTFTVRAKDGKLTRARMAWDYTPELIPQDVPVRDAGLLKADKPTAVQPEAGIEDSIGAPQFRASDLKSLFSRIYEKAIHPLADVFAAMREEAATNPFMIGAKKSFVPRLGKVLWQADKKNPFHAYVFETKDGRKAGFVRISSYEGGAKEVKAFREIIAQFKKQSVSGLVIDQVHNPGGSVFYMYALLSHLTDKPLLTAHHRMIIGESDAQWAADLLLKVMKPSTKRSAAKAEADEEESEDEGFSGSGYPITQKFMMLMVQFAQFILQQFDAGKRFTDPTHLWGVDDIDPAENAAERLAVPTVLLIDGLDFSGGDFFPATMQDNQRAALLALDEGTAGAGGAVRPYELPNQFGIEHLSATWTIAQRRTVDPKDPNNGQPIENRRVLGDIRYSLTEKDMRTGFSGYRLAILKALEERMGPPPAPAPAPAKPAKAKKK